MFPDIGLVAPARSGKDTVAGILARQAGYTRIAFADPLKAILADMDPYVGADYGDEGQPEPWRLSSSLDETLMSGDARTRRLTPWEAAKEEVPDVRRLLQRLGVAAREHLGPDVWVRAAERQRAGIDGPCVFTDVRFPNELDWLRYRGAVIVRIDRPGYEPGPDAHVSETALDDVWPDYTLLNIGTLTELHARVARLLEHIGIPRR